MTKISILSETRHRGIFVIRYWHGVSPITGIYCPSFIILLVLNLIFSDAMLKMATASVPAIAKDKRFRFTTDFDVALLRYVSSSGAHLAAHGKT